MTCDKCGKLNPGDYVQQEDGGILCADCDPSPRICKSNLHCARCGRYCVEFTVTGDGITCLDCQHQEVYGDDGPPIEDSDENLR